MQGKQKNTCNNRPTLIFHSFYWCRPYHMYETDKEIANFGGHGLCKTFDCTVRPCGFCQVLHLDTRALYYGLDGYWSIRYYYGRDLSWIKTAFANQHESPISTFNAYTCGHCIWAERWWVQYGIQYAMIQGLVGIATLLGWMKSEIPNRWCGIMVCVCWIW